MMIEEDARALESGQFEIGILEDAADYELLGDLPDSCRSMDRHGDPRARSSSLFDLETIYVPELLGLRRFDKGSKLRISTHSVDHVMHMRFEHISR